MMNNKILNNIIYNFIDKNNKLDDSTLQWIKNDKNKRLYDVINQLLSTQSDYNSCNLDDIHAKLRAKIQMSDIVDKIKIHNKQHLIKSIVYSSLSTAAFLFVIFGVYTNLPNKETPEFFSFEMPYSNKASLVLSDGTNVMLRAGSKINYSDFNKERREVTLSGEAFFDVKKKSSQFIVNTHNSSIIVKGTKFNVKANLDDDFVETSLIEGRVLFKFKGQDNKVDSISMAPNERVVYNKTSLKCTESIITEPEEYIINNEYKFDNTPLSEVFETVSLIHNVTFNTTNDINKIRYTGVLRGTHTLDNIVKLITKTTNLKYKFISEKEITIYKNN